MAVPMEDHGMVIGVVNVDSESLMPTGNHRQNPHLLTNEATRVISRLWLIMQLRTKANQLESLVVMSQRRLAKSTVTC